MPACIRPHKKRPEGRKKVCDLLQDFEVPKSYALCWQKEADEGG